MADATQRLFMDLKVGHSLTIDGTTVTLEQKSGQLARLKIEHVGAKVVYTGPELRKLPRTDPAKAA